MSREPRVNIAFSMPRVLTLGPDYLLDRERVNSYRRTGIDFITRNSKEQIKAVREAARERGLEVNDLRPPDAFVEVGEDNHLYMVAKVYLR